MEVISNNFNFDNDKPKQSLLRDDDVYSAIQLTGSKFINSELYLNYINGDRRIPLGMFFFNEKNINENSIEIFNNEIFSRVLQPNLISNGSCENVREYYYETDNPSVFTNCLKPDGGWIYLNTQGITTLIGTGDIDDGGNGFAEQAIVTIENDVDEDGQFPASSQKRLELEKHFYQDNFSLNDGQGYRNYGGYYPYIPIDESDLKKYYGFGPNGYFSSTVDTNDVDEDGQWLWRRTSTEVFPTIATWIQDEKAYSNNRCLIFKSPSSWNIDEMPTNTATNINFMESFTYSAAGSEELYHPQIADNQYRTLNQAQIITTPSDGIGGPLKVRFKMKTLVKNQDGVTFPEVEAGVVLMKSYGLDQVGGPNLYDTLGNSSHQSAYTIAKGGFNSKKYYNGSTFDEKKASDFGGLLNFKNTELDTWEEMEFNFTLSDDILTYLSQDPKSPLTFIIQSGQNFNGTVLMDDFEVFESYDFYPDVDVRKKISTGKYGKGDLTEYYDKDLQPEEYKDTTAPLEAQFYFHPRYNSDRIFNVDRTPIYNDFKKGFFYVYDIDWGDGTPNEFTSEPEQIDEEKVVLHNYEKSGIFKVTGNMLRLKSDTDGNTLGLVHNSTFSLYININEGNDDDFNFFNIYGFSTIPYKNTTPVIGGISKESSYYKTIKRQLGFLNNDGYTKIEYPDRYSKIKAQKALLNMDDSYLGLPELDELNAYFNDYSQTTITQDEEEIINDTPILERTSINNLNLFTEKVRMTYSDWIVYSSNPDNAFPGYFTIIFKIDEPDVNKLATILGVNPITGGTGFQSIPSENYQSYNFFHITNTGLSIEKERNFDGDITTTPLGTDESNLLPFSIQEDLIYDTNASQGSTRLKYRKKLDGNSYLYLAARILSSGEEYGIIYDNAYEISITGAYIDIGLYFCKYPLKTTSQVGDADDGNHVVHIQNLSDDELLKMHSTFGESAHSVIFKDLGRLTLGWPLSVSEFNVGGNSDIPSENYLVWASRSRWDIAIYLWFIEQYKSYHQDYSSLTHDYLMNSYIFSGESRDENNANLINWLFNGMDIYNPFDFLSTSYQSGGIWNNFNDNQQWPPGGLEVTTNLIFNGIKSLAGELGKSLGDCDLTSVKYYNTPKSIWEMFGFEETDLNQVGKPDEPRYWKNIIPEDYSIFTREGLGVNEQPEYLATLPFPQYLEEFDIDGDGEASPVDASRWLRPDIGAFRPDIANLIAALRVGNNPPTEYIYPDYVYEWVDEESILSGNGLEQPIENFYNTRSTINTYSEQEWIGQNEYGNTYYYPVLPKYGSDGKFIEGDFSNNKIPFAIQGSITDEQEKNKNLQINITTNKAETNTFSDLSGNSNIGLAINDYKIKLDEKLTFAKTKYFKNLKTKSKNGAF